MPTLSWMPILVLTTSADAQHRCSALLSVLIPSITSRHNYSHAGHKTSTPHHCLHLPLCFPLNHSTMIYAYPLWLYLTITSDHHLHRSLHIRPPFSIEYLSLYPSYPLLVSLPHTSSHSSISFSLLNYVWLHSFLIHNTTICSLFPLSIFQLSISFLLVVPLYIYLGTYSSTYSSFVSLARNCLTALPP